MTGKVPGPEPASFYPERVLAGDWALDAACRGMDPELWFAERGDSTREAKEVCRTCPVRLECREYAMTNGEKWGVWGGLSERERRRMRSTRRRSA